MPSSVAGRPKWVPATVEMVSAGLSGPAVTVVTMLAPRVTLNVRPEMVRAVVLEVPQRGQRLGALCDANLCSLALAKLQLLPFTSPPLPFSLLSAFFCLPTLFCPTKPPAVLCRSAFVTATAFSFIAANFQPLLVVRSGSLIANMCAIYLLKTSNRPQMIESTRTIDRSICRTKYIRCNPSFASPSAGALLS